MRKLVWFTVGFAAACFVCAYFYCSYLIWFALVALLLSGAGFVAMRFKRMFCIIMAVFLGMAAGFAGFCLYDGVYLQKVRPFHDTACEMVAVVDDYSVESDYGCSTEGTVKVNGLPYRVRIYFDAYYELTPGDEVTGRFDIAFTADGGDGISPQHRGKGIFLTALQKDKVQIERGNGFRIWHYPAVWRNQLSGYLEKSFPDDVSGFAKGLLLGDRTDIDYETKTAFEVSGIIHIIAVSGLHVSILYAFISLLTMRRRLLTAIIVIPILIIFAAVVGFTPSVTRACIMYILMILAGLLLREYDGPTELAFSVLVMLVVNPLAITSVSLQMSTACVAGIFMFSGRIRSRLLGKRAKSAKRGLVNKLLNWCVGSVSITLGAMVFTTPLCAYYFGTVSIIGVVTNLFTLWVVSFIFYGILAICIAALIWQPLASVIGWVIAWLIRYVVFIAKTFASIPFAAVYTQNKYILIWLIVSYALLVVLLCMKRKRIIAFAGTVVVMLLISIGVSCITPAMDDYRISVLDVGRGQCIVLQSEGRTFVVDCGGDYDEGAADIAAEYLLSQGICRIDGLILTHYDSDHAAGAAHLLSRLDAHLVYLPNVIDVNGVAQDVREQTSGVVEMVTEETFLQFGSSELRLFPSESYNSGNESSMCILFRTEKCAILITGDREEVGERLLVTRNELPDIDILVVGHHGARGAASQLLLDATKPEYAVISVDKDNPYGHPTQAVLDRLAAFGCKVYRTDRDGTVIFRG